MYKGVLGKWERLGKGGVHNGIREGWNVRGKDWDEEVWERDVRGYMKVERRMCVGWQKLQQL